VLGVVNLHGGGVNVGLERLVRVRQVGKEVSIGSSRANGHCGTGGQRSSLLEEIATRV
jgi:hypothetical protein